MLRELATRLLAFCGRRLVRCDRIWRGRCGRRCGLSLRFGFGFGGLALFELQLELCNLALDALRRAAVFLAPEPGKLKFELLDLERVDHQPRLGGGELRGCGSEFCGSSSKFCRELLEIGGLRE